MTRKLGALILAVLVTAAIAAPAAAGPSQYVLPVWFYWDRTALDVVIIPPEHGQIYNANGLFGGEGPNELTPDNSYMRAIEDSIDAWDRAIDEFGSERLRRELDINVYVLGRDSEALSRLAGAEIIILTDQTKAMVLGFALTGFHCIVDNSKMFVSSFTYADMYNVNSQEYGHCLGLDHVLDDQPQTDVMNGHYPYNIGAKDNPIHGVSNLDVMGLDSVFFKGPDVLSIAPSLYDVIDVTR